MRWVLRSKIHKATVTEANVEYIGSITIDADLIEKSGLMVHEKVAVVSNTTDSKPTLFSEKRDRALSA